MFDGKIFKQHKIKDGVSSDESFTLYVDDLDNVWVGTYGGGVCFYDGNIWNSIDSRDGLHNNTIKSICGSNGNKYWFGLDMESHHTHQNTRLDILLKKRNHK